MTPGARRRRSHNLIAYLALALGKPIDGTAADILAELARVFGPHAQRMLWPRKGEPLWTDILDAAVDADASYASVDEFLARLEPASREFLLHGVDKQALFRLLPYLVPLQDQPAPTPGTGAEGVWREIGPLTVDGVDFRDPRQFAVDDCALISALSALAWTQPEGLLQRLQATQDPAGGYRWQFVSAMTMRKQRVPRKPLTVSARVLDQVPSYVARSTVSDESWPSIVEKAYVKWKRKVADGDEPTLRDYQKLYSKAELPPVTMVELVGGTFIWQQAKPWLKAACEGDQLISQGITRHPTCAWTKDPDDEGYDAGFMQAAGITPKHAYTVLGLLEDGREQYVVLRDPTTAPRLATQPRTARRTEWQPSTPRLRQPLPLESEGIVAIVEKDFYKAFKEVGWAKPPPAP